MIKITPFRLRRLARTRAAQARYRVPASRACAIEQFVADLGDLHDAISSTSLHGHYWLCGGLLAGWARERRVLPRGHLDADFCLIDADFDRLVRATPAILAAGFRRDRRFINNSGTVTELTFARHGARFDFFRGFPEADGMRYFLYKITLTRVTELEAVIPDQPTEPFTFLGRTWLKPADHELALRAVYGNWAVPDPSWSYLDSLSIVARHPSRHAPSDFDWRGPRHELATAAARGPTSARGGRADACRASADDDEPWPRT